MDKSKNEKQLVSFYLSQETVERIDDFLFYARKRLPLDKRRKLTKSVFYETGIKMLIEEYDIEGLESQIWKTLANLFNS